MVNIYDSDYAEMVLVFFYQALANNLWQEYVGG